jgi:glycosyltransferase involved in cell wall biosynthesis
MRVIAVLATYNEDLCIAGCLEHLFRHGVEVHLIDNCSTDRTVAIAERYLRKGLIDIETYPRPDGYSWRPILERKEQIAASLDADWVMHVDADEIHLPPHTDQTLVQAFADAEAQGYNAVNFLEFTFIPTREAPDHEHPDFQKTMRFYYPFAPSFPYLMRAWRQQPAPPELAWSGGHLVRFPGLSLSPVIFPMRHYLFLSVPHAIRKYVNRRYDPTELEAGWHGWRAKLQSADLLQLPPSAELRPYRGDGNLDPSEPRSRHYLDELLNPASTRDVG